jgi:hypothetical protein
VPKAAVLTPLGTILYMEIKKHDDTKKLKLEIFYKI